MLDVAIVQPSAFPAEMPQKSGIGSDPSVLDGYEMIADVPNKMGSAIGQMFETVKLHPKDVADAIINLINLQKDKGH